MTLGEDLLDEQNARGEILRSLEYMLMDLPPLFSRRIGFPLKLESQQPWLYFQGIIRGGEYTFRLHDLQLREDAGAWHFAAQMNSEATFRGYQSAMAILTNNRYGYIIGEVEIPRVKKFKIEIMNENVEVKRLFLDRECMEEAINFIILMANYPESKKRKVNLIK